MVYSSVGLGLKNLSIRTNLVLVYRFEQKLDVGPILIYEFWKKSSISLG
jgi:hypothetical protein